MCDLYFPERKAPPAAVATRSRSDISVSRTAAPGGSSGNKGGVGGNKIFTAVRSTAVPRPKRRLADRLSVNVEYDANSNSSDSSHESRRQLRLRSYQGSSGFSFIPELVGSTGRERTTEFRHSYARMSAAVKASLDQVEARLRPFGYSLREWTPSSDTAATKSNVFSPWEFVV